MTRTGWLLAGVLLPLTALAAEAPGPGWAFLTPDANAPTPAVGGAAAPPAAEAGAPAIVVNGNGAAVRACNTCHLPSGLGQPESANLRGLNADYFARQMHDFAAGTRGGPRGEAMAGIAKAMTDDEIKQTAAYYAGLKPLPWTKVVEADRAPKTLVGRNSQRIKLLGSDTEEVALRIIEVADSPDATRQTARPAFTAYAPKGARQKGRNIATTGGGKTEACIGCHGDGVMGEDDVPSLAGRSPVYLARQIYSFKNGIRKSDYASVMKDVVAKLTDEDIVSVAAYIGSLDPS